MPSDNQVFDETSLYALLARALDALPQGFPPTELGIEIELLKIMFSEDEARIAACLSDQWEAADDIASRMHLPHRRVLSILRLMSMKEQLQGRTYQGVRQYRLNQFIVGSWEATMFRLQGEKAHRFAHLSEEYVSLTGGLAGIMTPSPAIHRVIPAQSAVKTEWVLPYDDVKAILMEAQSFFLRDCVCRKAQDALNQRRCTFTRRACLSFSHFQRPSGSDSITKHEALAFLDEAERMGLVHTVSNVAKGVNYVCNCCGCCCGILRGIAEFGLKDSVAQANYFVFWDEQTCSLCGQCVFRCQTNAITVDDTSVSIDGRRCIGCGLCVTACPQQALVLALKPEDEILVPPGDLAHWETLRKAQRGLR